MSRILITGSADGLSLLAAQLLIRHGREVVLDARNQAQVADVSDDPAATASGAYFYHKVGAPRTLPSPTPACRRACSRPVPN